LAGAVCLSGCASTALYARPSQGQPSATLTIREPSERQEMTTYLAFDSADCVENDRSGLLATTSHAIYPIVTTPVRANERLYLMAERVASAPGVYSQQCFAQVAFTPEAGGVYDAHMTWNTPSGGCVIIVRDGDGKPAPGVETLRPSEGCLKVRERMFLLF